MLYCEITAENENEAVEKAAEKLRVNPQDIELSEIQKTPEGIKAHAESTVSRGELADGILGYVLECLGVSANRFYLESLENITVNMTGPDLGLLIGKNGSTLESLETIVSAIHNRDFIHYKPVILNPGGYRENKKKFLKTLVRKAMSTVESERSVKLAPMCRSDRKMVHEIVNDFDGFTSASEGDASDRHIIISAE